MHKTAITTIVGGLLVASSAVAGNFAKSIPAPSTAAKGDLAVGYSSQNMFRGVNLGDDVVSAEINLDLVCPLSGYNLDFNALYLTGASSSSTQGEDELRLTLSTSKDLGFATGTVGYTYYQFLNGGNDDAQELFFGLNREFYGVGTSLTYFHDIEGDNQGYTELGLTKSLDVLGNTINFGTTVGYLAEEGALSHVTVSASYDYAFGKAIITPYVAYSVEFDDLERAGRAGASEENELFAGAALKVQF